MKAFYVVLLLVFLASCGSEVNVETPSDPVVQETTQEMNDALAELPEEIEVSTDTSVQQWDDAKIVQLAAPYTNPKWPVDMQIEYSLDEQGNIESINVFATSYDLTNFNQSIQSVIGMSVEEASDYYVSGSSLTTPAYQEALKSSL